MATTRIMLLHIGQDRTGETAVHCCRYRVGTRCRRIDHRPYVSVLQIQRNYYGRR